jgi:hypothetical protein
LANNLAYKVKFDCHASAGLDGNEQACDEAQLKVVLVAKGCFCKLTATIREESVEVTNGLYRYFTF